MTVAWLLLAGACVLLPRRTSPRAAGPAHRSIPPAHRSRPRAGAALSPRLTASVGIAAIVIGVALAGGCGAAAWWAAPMLLARTTSVGIEDVARMPLVLDLGATILRTGQPVDSALTLAAAAAGPRLQDELRRTAGLLRLGAEPELAWSEVAADARLRPVAVVAVRSADSGIRLAEGWSALAHELRAEAVTAANARAVRAGTWVMAPLGLCFLPAFVCLGIAPVIVGIATGLISGGLV
jgi:Flp pilus assembly protein TadB